jgi:hypothetical protein
LEPLQEQVQEQEQEQEEEVEQDDKKRIFHREIAVETTHRPCEKNELPETITCAHDRLCDP